MQRQAARVLLESADLADSRAATLALVAKQRAEWLGTAAHARALSRLQTAVELATQLQIKWETQRREVRRSVRKKVDARVEQVGGVHDRKGRLKLSTAKRVDLRVSRVAKELESAAESAADALERSRKPSALRRLAKEKERAERRREGGGDDATLRIPIEESTAAPKRPEPPQLEQMEMPHQHIPSVLWRMYEDVFAHPRSSYRLRRAMQDVVETIHDLNPYFFLKTLYRPPPVSDHNAQSDERWEVRRSKKVDAIVTSLMPLFHELSYRAQRLSSSDPGKRRKAWHDATTTLQLVRKLALHFHFVMLHLYAVTMGRHDRKATPWTFEQLVYAAQCDESAFREALGLVEESARPKDFLITETYELAPELLVFMDAWHHQNEFGRVGDPVTTPFGFTPRERFQPYIPVFENFSTQSTPSMDKWNAVQELGLELKQLCDDWIRSPLGSGSFGTIRIEVLGVVEKTIKHRLRGIMEIVHKITLARWMQRRERSSRANWWRRLNLRKKPAKKNNRETDKASPKSDDSCLVGQEAERPGCVDGEKDAGSAAQHEQEEVVGAPASSMSPAAASTAFDGQDKEEKVVADASGSSSVPVNPTGSTPPARCDVAPTSPKATPSEPQREDKDLPASTPMAGEAVTATNDDYRKRVKKIPEDPQQTAARDGFRAPVSVTQAAWLASNSRDRSSKAHDDSTSQNPSNPAATTRLLPQQAAGGVVLLKDVYAWTDDEIDAHEREMERICDVRNELLGLRDALTVVKLEPDASERLGCRSARRVRAASALSLDSLTFAAVSVQARALSETVAAFGEEIAMHGAAEALIKRPNLRAAAADSSGPSSNAQPSMASLENAKSPLKLVEFMRTLQTHLAGLDEPTKADNDETSAVSEPSGVPARLAHVGTANLALLRMVNEKLAAIGNGNRTEGQQQLHQRLCTVEIATPGKEPVGSV